MIAAIVAGAARSQKAIAALFILLALNDYIIGEPRGRPWPLFRRRK